MFRHANTAIIRCVGLTTYQRHMTVVRKSRSISLLEPSGSVRPVQGLLYLALYGHHQLVVQFHKKKCILGKGLPFTNIICDIFVN